MANNIAFIINDITTINPLKDSSFAMMLAAQKRNYNIFCFDIRQMTLTKTGVIASILEVKLTDNTTNYFKILTKKDVNLNIFKAIIMRQDPPFNMNYIYATYLLEYAVKQGVLVLNKPQALRDFNEKIAIMSFPSCITDTIVTSNIEEIQQFIDKQQTAIVKPLDNMGGVDIFKIAKNDDYKNIIIRLTNNGQTPIMVQKYLKEINQGDKRILIINGKPIPYALARIPKKGSFKGNLAAGATGIGQELSKRDKYLCTQISPILQKNGLAFVGLDVIGDYITEINVTSPTGIRELDKQYNIDIAGEFIDYVSETLT